MKKARIFFFFLLISKITFGQEMWGIANSNYAGNMGMHLNPASMVGAPYKYEINLIAADFFFDNNYLYWSNIGSVINGGHVYDFTNPSSKHAYMSTLIIGPSYISNKGNSAWAIRTEFREVASANHVPYDLAKTLYSDFKYAPQYGVTYTDTKVKSAGMVFADVAFSYGRVLRESEENWMAWGATAHGIIAFDGVYLNTSIDSYVIPNDSTWNVQNINMDYAHAVPGGTHSNLGQVLSFRGAGASLDGGVIYEHRRLPAAFKCDRDADMAKKYDYRVGLSLLDVGYVSYFNGASKYHLSGSGTWTGVDTAIKITSLPDFDQQINGTFNGSKTSDGFGMFMPAAASAQFDYCFKPRLYANLSVIQRIPISYREVMRENSVALVPRYETRRFEASLSANMYEYEHVEMGVAFRFSVFVIGTDRLLEFFTSPVRSYDLFFGIKYNSCTMNSKKKKTGQCPFD